MDTLFVSGLRVDAILGILPEERTATQPVLVDIEYALDTRPAAASGDIADTVSYADVADSVSAWIVDGRYELVETLADEVAGRLLSTYAMVWVRLRVTKPDAVAAAAGVGIEVTRGQA